MREIKFRAWDEGNNKYIFDFNFNDYEITDKKGSITVSKILERSGTTPCLLLEQYTGLKDKNGVEIYEGDIIKLGDDTYDYGYDKGELVKVCWERETCGFKPFCDTHSDYNLINNKTCEIIGNIHENEDLLK